MEKKKILRELTKDVHMPSFCTEEGYCEALDDCAAIDVGECSCCNINRIVRAFNKGIEFQKEKSKTSWISVKDDLPCNHEELMEPICQLDNRLIYETKRVFVHCSNNSLDTAHMINFYNRWKWYPEDLDVKYWFPIPELPK